MVRSAGVESLKHRMCVAMSSMQSNGLIARNQIGIVVGFS